MEPIREAEERDVSRIAEILVFTKRMNYRSIFHNDLYSFGELQVLPVAREYLDHPDKLKSVWVYDDGFVKGLIHVEGREVVELYVDSFFAGQGVGGKLLTFAVHCFDVQYLWALEKNVRARAFYQRHGFCHRGAWKYEEGTPERLLKLERGKEKTMANDVKNFLDAEGRLKQYPSKRKMKALALAYLAGKLEANKAYTERELNETLYRWHTFGDPATLRRELYDLRFIDRAVDGSEYRLADPQPDMEELLARFS